MAKQRDSRLTPVKQLIEEAARRRGEQSSRIHSYTEFLEAIISKDNADEKMIQDNDSAGRPLLRLRNDGNGVTQRHGAPNLLAPMIDDLVSLRGIMPDVTVPPAKGDPQSRDKATLMTRALREQMDHSQMDIQQPTSAFFLSALGDTCYVLNPRLPVDCKNEPDPFRPEGIYITVVNPTNAYPAFRFGDTGQEMVDLYLIWTLPAEVIKRTYGIDLSKEQETGDVIHYYSTREKQILVAGRSISATYHDLGFVPAQWCSNKATDGRFAQSDIREAVALHRELQEMWYVYIDAMVWAVYPIAHIENREQFAQDHIEIGPGAQIESTGEGKITLLAPAANPQAARLIYETAKDNLLEIVGVAPVRIQGQIDRSNVSARSVDRQQAPMEQRVAMANKLLGACHERLNSKILLMLNKIPELKKTEMELYGQDEDGSYSETFTGEDLGGWTRNIVKFDASGGSNRHEKEIMALQLHKDLPGKIPSTFVMREAGIDDPKALIEEAQAEMKEDHAMQAQMQPHEAPPGGGGPPGKVPGRGPGRPPGGGTPGGGASVMKDMMHAGAGGLNGGGAPPSGPSQPPHGPPQGVRPSSSFPAFAPIATAPSQRGIGTPGPLPDLMGAVKKALQSVQMHGEVIDEKVITHGIHIDVSDHRDIKPVHDAVLEAVKTIFPKNPKVEVKVPKKQKVK